MGSLRIQSRVIESVKKPNCKFTCFQVLQLLVLFPFFFVKNAANYSSSALGKLFACHKDMFYRFMNDGNINWRRIIYSVFGYFVDVWKQFLRKKYGLLRFYYYICGVR